MRETTAVLLALLLAAPGLAEEAPESTPETEAAALLSADVRTGWEAARALVERPGSDSTAVRKALAALVEDAGLPVETPRSLKRKARAGLLDRIRQAALLARLAARGVEVPAGMVAVPGGIAARPITHEAVLVPDFFLDRTEVTRDAFAAFVAKGGHRPEGEGYLEGWTDGKPPKETGSRPVVHVSRADAAAFATWRGARLPTAEEWWIARGGCGRTAYPWGEVAKPGRANVMDAKGSRRLEPVEGRPGGATPLGVLRLAGNATEWTSTPRGADLDRSFTAGESFLSVPAFRAALLRAASADARRRDLGFRCASTIPAPPTPPR